MRAQSPFQRSLLVSALLWATASQSGEPDGLDRLLQQYASQPRAVTPMKSADATQRSPSTAASTAGPRRPARIVTDDEGRVLVNVRLASAEAAADTVSALEALGFRIKTRSIVDTRLLVGHIQPAQLAAAQALPGVSAILAARGPVLRAGAALTPRLLSGMRSDYAQATGFNGRGIRVGALSDSFDINPRAVTRAAGDVATGDLPAAGVTVLVEAPADDAAFAGDEGRAMLQLVHDIAPGAALAFAASGNSSVEFANNIIALRERFKADIIVDDVVFTDEPFFSDGVVAQAVDRVVASGAAYFSSVGNNSLQGYEGVFQAMPFQAALDLEAQNKVPVKLSQIPAAQRPLSVHVFGAQLDGRSRLTQRLVAPSGCSLVLQWDEPFGKGLVKTDYDVYLFNMKGDWLDPTKVSDDIAAVTNNRNTVIDEPLESVTLGGALQDVYMVIGKRNQGAAGRLKHIANGQGCGTEDRGASTALGHVYAKGTFSVGATEYQTPRQRSPFSSAGPGVVYLDRDGRRLATPEVRQAPRAMAIQGADTTFFGFDVDNSGYPNFPGTSASAPAAAGVAAQVLQAAGGPGKLKPADLYNILQETARRIPFPDSPDLGVASAGPVMLSVNGYTSFTHGYYRLDLQGWAEAPLRSVTIDLTPTPFKFSDRLSDFQISDKRGVGNTDVKPSIDSTHRKITITASASGKFRPGEVLSFRWLTFGPAGDADLTPYDIRGAVLTATLENGKQYRGTLQTEADKAVNRFTGWGLLDAAAATARAARP